MTTAKSFDGVPDPSTDPASQAEPDDLQDVESDTSFPLSDLPPIAVNMVLEIARVSTSGNVPLAAMSVIGVGAASLGGGIQLASGGGRLTKGNLYILGIAESGAGKGESFNLAAEPFYAAERDALRSFEIETSRSLNSDLQLAEKRSKSIAQKAASKSGEEAEALQKEFRQVRDQVSEIEKKLASAPKYSVADVTKEALGIAMVHQPHNAIASLSSEARGILSIIKGRYGKEGGDEDLYCSAYSGDPITVDRVNRDRVHLPHPCLSLLWFVQPGAAQDALGDDKLRDSGFFARCLIVDPKAEPKVRDMPPSPVCPFAKKRWSGAVTDLLSAYRNNPGEPKTVRPDESAVKILYGYEQENVIRRRNNGDLADIASFVARWSENAWRLALVFHALEHGKEA